MVGLLFAHHLFAILSAKNQYLKWKEQKKSASTKNATRRKRLEWSNNDSFEWAMTATNIINFCQKNPKKSRTKTKKYSRISTAETCCSTCLICSLFGVYVTQSLTRCCSWRFRSSLSYNPPYKLTHKSKSLEIDTHLRLDTLIHQCATVSGFTKFMEAAILAKVGFLSYPIWPPLWRLLWIICS